MPRAHSHPAFRKRIAAALVLLAVTRALTAAPCEHHRATRSAATDAAASGHHAGHNVGAGDTEHSPHQQPSHEGDCTCVGHCATQLPVGLPQTIRSDIGGVATGELQLAFSATIRIADRTPANLPWPTAPPV